MRKIIFLSVMFTFIFCLTALAQIEFSSADKISSSLSQLNQELQGQEMIGSIGKFFGDEIINLYVEPNNLIFTIITNDKKIEKIELAENEDPSLKVFTSEEVISEVLSSQNQMKALRKVIQEEKITYKAIGFSNKIKFAFLKMFFKITEEDKADNVEEIVEEETEELENVDEIEDNSEIKEEVEVEEVEAETEEPEVEELEEENSAHTITINKEGFSPKELKIKRGDTVEWKVNRTGYLNKAMVLGTMQCVQVKSGVLQNEETFSWTFDKVKKCTIVDGITTTQIGTIIIEE